MTRVKKTDTARGRVKGEWNRYVKAHGPPNGRPLEARRERLRLMARRYYAAHREKIRAQQNAARRPLSAEAVARGNRARDARRRGRFVEHVHPLVVLERDDGVCGICGDDVDPTNFHVDHVEALASGGEHSYANVQTAHPECNRRKGCS